MKTKKEATDLAKRAFKGHGLKGAKVNIFENLGWHVCLRHKHYAIWPEETNDGRIKYHGMASFNGSGCGDCRWTKRLISRHNTPKLALAHMLAEIRGAVYSKHVEDMHLMEDISESLKG